MNEQVVNKYTIFLPNIRGGVNSIVKNLVVNKTPQVAATIITYGNNLRDNILKADTSGIPLKRIDFQFMAGDNIYHTAKKLRNLLPASPGTIIATDAVELDMVNITQLDAKIIFIVMGDFEHYYNIACRHSSIIDGYIAISKDIYDRLVILLPDRKDSIHLAYFPTPDVSKRKHETANGKTRAIFVGRLDESKNPLLIAEIDKKLKEQDCTIEWTIVGDGLLLHSLKVITKDRDNFHYKGILPNEELRELYFEQDIFIMTSLTEGLPVSLIEAMKTGLVPVVSDIHGGIREIVENNQNGFLCEVNNAVEFASAIEKLSREHLLYQKFSEEAKMSMGSRFDALKNTEHYFRLFEAISYTPGTKEYVYRSVNRLDKKWLPNILVRLARTSINKLRPWR